MRSHVAFAGSATVVDIAGKRGHSVRTFVMANLDRDELFLEASKAFDRQDFRKAFRGFHQAARLGHASAQHNLGYLFDAGKGVRRDREKALYWYKRAWRNDRQTGSSSNIAALYAQLDQPSRAISWWKRGVDL